MIPRWMLTAKYIGFVVLGTAAAYAGIPTLNLTTWYGYTTWWGIALAIAAVVAGIGSVKDAWQVTEKWGAVGVSALMLAYLAGAITLVFGGNPAGFALRSGLVIILFMVTMLPALRAGHLLTRTGIRR